MWLSGCCHHYVRAPDRPMPEIVSAVKQRRACFDSFKVADAEFTFISHTGEGKSSFSCTGVAYMDISAGRLWIRAEKVVQDIFDLKVCDDRFVLILFETREVAVGGRQVRSRLPFLLWPDEIFTGYGAEAPPDADWQTPGLDRHRNWFILRFKRGGHTVRQVWVDALDLRVVGVQDFNLWGDLTTVLKFDDYRDLGGCPWPHRIEIHRKLRGISVIVKMRNVALNPEVGKIRWGHVPERYERHDLDTEPLENLRAFGAED